MNPTKKDLAPYVKQIKDWLAGNKKKPLLWKNLCPDWLYQSVRSIKGVDIKDDLETNGWEGDYWQTFSYQENRYQMLGSAHYGNAQIEVVRCEEHIL